MRVLHRSVSEYLGGWNEDANMSEISHMRASASVGFLQHKYELNFLSLNRFAQSLVSQE